MCVFAYSSSSSPSLFFSAHVVTFDTVRKALLLLLLRLAVAAAASTLSFFPFFVGFLSFFLSLSLCLRLLLPSVPVSREGGCEN